MSQRRRQFREFEVLAVLLMQGAILPCKRCRVGLKLEDLKSGGVQKEHLHELRLGGEDEPHNCAYSHTDCHAIITNGNGATTAGSSTNRIAKATEPKRIEKFVVNKEPMRLAQLIDAGARCRRCGQYSEECQCPALQVKSRFAGARR